MLWWSLCQFSVACVHQDGRIERVGGVDRIERVGCTCRVGRVGCVDCVVRTDRIDSFNGVSRVDRIDGVGRIGRTSRPLVVLIVLMVCGRIGRADCIALVVFFSY